MVVPPILSKTLTAWPPPFRVVVIGSGLPLTKFPLSSHFAPGPFDGHGTLGDLLLTSSPFSKNLSCSCWDCRNSKGASFPVLPKGAGFIFSLVFRPVAEQRCDGVLGGNRLCYPKKPLLMLDSLSVFLCFISLMTVIFSINRAVSLCPPVFSWCFVWMLAHLLTVILLFV